MEVEIHRSLILILMRVPEVTQFDDFAVHWKA